MVIKLFSIWSAFPCLNIWFSVCFVAHKLKSEYSQFLREKPALWFDLIAKQGLFKSLSLCVCEEKGQMCKPLHLSHASRWMHCPLKLAFTHNASAQSYKTLSQYIWNGPCWLMISCAHGLCWLMIWSVLEKRGSCRGKNTSYLGWLSSQPFFSFIFSFTNSSQ